MKGVPGNTVLMETSVIDQERENLTSPKLLHFCTNIGHEAWVLRHLNSEDSFFVHTTKLHKVSSLTNI